MNAPAEADPFCETPAGLRLCFRVQGPAGGEAVLLIAGLGLQLVFWPQAFVQAFTAAGLRVVTFDNRDVGRSSRVASPPPGKARQFFALPPKGNYALEDMADDAACLVRHLGLRGVHAVGMSMGGMIAQVLACRHPALVRSLASIFSNTGRRRVGQPAPSTLWRMATAGVPRTADEAVARYVKFMRHVGAPQAPGSEDAWRAYAREAWERSGGRFDGSGIARQIGAIQKSGDRTEQLRRIRAPTLVIHGDVDLLVHPSGGRATAEAIPGARLAVVDGMRHDIDPLRAPQVASLVLSHIQALPAH